MQDRLLLILLCLLLKTLHLNGQVNLVPNPSFEEYIECPNSISQIEKCISWYHIFNGAIDYYNSCSHAPSSGSSVPIHSNVFYKQPRSGNGFVGFRATYLNSNVNIRSYIGARLNKRLKRGVLYYAEFYVSPRHNIREDNYNYCVIDKFGCSFSKDTVFDKLLPKEAMKKQNYFGHQGGLIDSLDVWTRIGGCVLGDNEGFITIGNFDSNEDTNTKIECFDIFPSATYYYIDDVGVYEFDPLPDTIIICAGETKEIGQKFLDGIYQWNTGSRDSTIEVSKSGTYIVDVDMGSCILSDTVVVVNMSDLDDYLPIDTTICQGTDLVVEIPVPGKYLWNTGSSNNNILISDAGSYQVIIENQCGKYNHSFNVQTQECGCQVSTANIFSPNGDAVNDEMIFYMDCQYPFKIHVLNIYDRWGNLVFEQKDEIGEKIRWSGKLIGIILSSGIYSWVISYSYFDNGHEISKVKTGNVTIIH